MADQINSELILALRNGDQNAFDAIFKKYYKLLCIEAKAYFRNHFLVEEIVCDVFTKIWQKRAELTFNSSLREYLVQSVRNNCINYYRMQKVQEKLKQEVDEHQKRAFSLVDIGENPLDYIISAELEKSIHDAVESLPERYKQAFKLSRYHDLSYKEIAIEMGITVDGVKMNIKKALEQLREKLSNYLISIIIMLSTLSNSKFF